MAGNIVGWLVIVLVSAGLAFLTWRAWRAKSAAVKWGGLVIGGLLTLAGGLLSVVTLIGLFKAYSPRNSPVRDLQVAGTPEQIARGQHLANTFCASCHSLTGELPLSGGFDLANDIPIPLGSFVAANLTPAGPLKDWSDGEIFRTLRNGIGADGRSLVIMSTFRGRNLSDEDTEALIAYLRSQPAVENDTPNPPDRLSMLGIVMLSVGMLPEGKPPSEAVITAPPKGATAEYGEYILSYQDCRDCHGEDLRGGVEGQLPPIGPSLEVVKDWTQEEFITTLRTGVNPTGHPLGDIMPWRNVGRMDDEELAAAYLYLTSVP
ncbi:MAG: c-type cytochrome [Anaerolineales bacterium]|nr:c-type cytochrome [Anaerolineales bacterium]